MHRRDSPAGKSQGAHGMNDVKHLLFTGPAVLRDAVEGKRLWRTSTALIECSYKAVLCLDFIQLLVEVTHDFSRRDSGLTGRVLSRLICGADAQGAPDDALHSKPVHLCGRQCMSFA